jgi:hypothetical protein
MVVGTDPAARIALLPYTAPPKYPGATESRANYIVRFLNDQTGVVTEALRHLHETGRDHATAPTDLGR